MKRKDGYCLFFTEKDPLSNWHRATFTADGKTYLHMEQYMMERKALLFGDTQKAQEIMATTHPMDAKKKGREVRGYRDDIWCAQREAIVTAGLIAKFSSNEQLKTILLETGEEILVEASPHDTIWGIGLGKNDPKALNPEHWRGLNLLGECLMRARASLQLEAKAKQGSSPKPC